VRIKNASRPKSYHQILEDFANQESGNLDFVSPTQEGDLDQNQVGNEETPPRHLVSISSSPTRREDTARRSKRFSMPAVALQTTSVTARTASGVEEGGRAKRFSLVLGGRIGGGHGASRTTHSHLGGRLSEGIDEGKHSEVKNLGDLGGGVAASRLSDLLKRRKN
jgi:FYVE/RhoGEF/PH domain-containing protein 5/6